MGMVDTFSHLIFNIYEAFTVALFLKENERLQCVSSVTFAQSFDRNRYISVEGTLPGWVIKHKEPLIIANFDKDESALGYYGESEGIKSFMGYPMEESGVIVVDSKKKYAFTDKEKKILGSFVAAIHEEIEKEKRFQDIEEKLEELYVERRMVGLCNELNVSKTSVADILQECCGIAGADAGFLCIEKNGKLYINNV